MLQFNQCYLLEIACHLVDRSRSSSEFVIISNYRDAKIDEYSVDYLTEAEQSLNIVNGRQQSYIVVFSLKKKIEQTTIYVQIMMKFCANY